MVQRRGGACFTFKAAQTLLLTSQVGRQQLQGDWTVQVSIPGQIDHTHAAAFKFTDDLVVTKLLAHQRCTLFFHQRLCCHGGGGCVHETLFLLVTPQQGFDFAAQYPVAAAGLAQESRALFRRAIQYRVKDFLNFGPLLWCHPGLWVSVPQSDDVGHCQHEGGTIDKLASCYRLGSASSRRSQALATRQSRFTVLVDTSKTLAVSSSLKPPKNISSTALDCRGSIFANLLSASSSATKSSS